MEIKVSALLNKVTKQIPWHVLDTEIRWLGGGGVGGFLAPRSFSQ